VGTPQHAVIVGLALSSEWGDPDEAADFDALEDQLIAAIDEAGVGEFDGTGHGAGFFDLYAYGQDADALFAVIEPIVRSVSPRPGSYAVKRYGEPGAPETRIEL
jgi:hypothetical protein